MDNPSDQKDETAGKPPEKPPQSLPSSTTPSIAFMRISTPNSSTSSTTMATIAPQFRLSNSQPKISVTTPISGTTTSNRMLILLPKTPNAKPVVLRTLRPRFKLSQQNVQPKADIVPAIANQLQDNGELSDIHGRSSNAPVAPIRIRKRKQTFSVCNKTAVTAANGASKNVALKERIEALERRVVETVRHFEARIMKLELTVAELMMETEESQSDGQ